MTAVSAATRWAETDVIRRLETEWQAIADSRHMQRCLRVWGVEDPRLAFEDGHQLVEAAQRREASSWAERDQVLCALLDRFEDDPVARRIALQVVLPQVKSLIRGLRGWDTEERAARVVATAVDVLAYCAAEPAGTPPSFRIFSNTRRRVLRAAIRDRSEPLVHIPDLSHLEDPAGHETTHPDEQQQIDELVEWVRERGRLREDAARLVVLTRVGGASVSELASVSGVSAQTMRRQRLRAEQRLRHGLSVAR
jgi:DNA-directed RNA polymerase specialized sigma24 family protein